MLVHILHGSGIYSCFAVWFNPFSSVILSVSFNAGALCTHLLNYDYNEFLFLLALEIKYITPELLQVEVRCFFTEIQIKCLTFCKFN